MIISSLSPRTKIILFGSLLFTVSFVIRLLFFMIILDYGNHSWLLVDSDHYHQLALSFLNNTYNSSLSFLRLPGYPAFLAGCYTVLGIHPPGALIIQLLCASSIPLLIYWLGITLFPYHQRAMLYATLFSCVHIGLVMYAGILSTESLFLIFLLLFFIFFFKAMNTEKKLLYLIAGIMLGIGSLIRPVGHYLLMLSCIILLIQKTQLRSLAVFIASWFCIAGIWLLHNFMLTGHLFFHTLPGQHFLQYSAAYVYQDAHHVSYLEARRDLMQQYDAQRNTIQSSVVTQCAVAEKIAYTTLMQYPWLTLKHALIHMTKSCIAPHTQLLFYLVHGWEHQPTSGLSLIKKFLWPDSMPWYMIILIYFDLITHSMLLLGMGWLLIKQIHLPQNTFIMLGSFMILFIGITLAYGSARLRLPIDPLLILCGASLL